MALLCLRNVSLTFGGPRLLYQVELQIEQGERLCLLGRNGEGKSTLLRLIRGEIQPDEGEVIRQQGLRISLLRQDVSGDRDGTVSDQVAAELDDGAEPATGSDIACRRLFLEWAWTRAAIRGPVVGNETASSARPGVRWGARHLAAR